MPIVRHDSTGGPTPPSRRSVAVRCAGVALLVLATTVLLRGTGMSERDDRKIADLAEMVLALGGVLAFASAWLGVRSGLGRVWWVVALVLSVAAFVCRIVPEAGALVRQPHPRGWAAIWLTTALFVALLGLAWLAGRARTLLGRYVVWDGRGGRQAEL